MSGEGIPGSFPAENAPCCRPELRSTQTHQPSSPRRYEVARYLLRRKHNIQVRESAYSTRLFPTSTSTSTSSLIDPGPSVEEVKKLHVFLSHSSSFISRSKLAICAPASFGGPDIKPWKRREILQLRQRRLDPCTKPFRCCSQILVSACFTNAIWKSLRRVWSKLQSRLRMFLASNNLPSAFIPELRAGHESCSCVGLRRQP